MPETSQVHVDAALTNLSVAYNNPAFAGDLIAPLVPVRKQSDRYFVLDAERDRFRASLDHRAPGAEASEVDFALSTDSYFCGDHALESVIADEERENADPAIAPDIDRAEFLTEKLLLNREIALADVVLNTGGFSTQTLSGGDQWDEDTSDPVGDIEQRRHEIHASIQREPNTLLLSHKAFSALRRHEAVRSLAGSGANGAPGPEQLAALLDVERVVVARSWKNIAAPGQDQDMEPVWGQSAALLYVPPRPGLKTIGAVYTFAWALAPGSVAGRVVETWREARRKADMIRVQMYYDLKVVATGACHVWKDAVDA